MQIDETYGKSKYMIALQGIKNKMSRRLDIFIEDLESYFNDDEFPISKIINNTKSYEDLFL